MYAIGIDSGTQGTKALVVDFDRGRVLGRGYAPHAMVPGLPPGASEQDPRTWVRAMEAAMATALKESRADPKKIVSLGISGQQHGFVPLDGKGRPIRPAKLWNDTSTIEETGLLVGIADQIAPVAGSTIKIKLVSAGTTWYTCTNATTTAPCRPSLFSC